MTETQPAPLTTADVKRRYSWDTAGHQPLPRYVGPFPDPDAAFDWVRHHAPLSGEFNSTLWPVRPEEVRRGR